MLLNCDFSSRINWLSKNSPSLLLHLHFFQRRLKGPPKFVYYERWCWYCWGEATKKNLFFFLHIWWEKESESRINKGNCDSFESKKTLKKVVGFFKNAWKFFFVRKKEKRGHPRIQIPNRMEYLLGETRKDKLQRKRYIQIGEKWGTLLQKLIRKYLSDASTFIENLFND